jgi:hypothetical protein
VLPWFILRRPKLSFLPADGESNNKGFKVGLLMSMSDRCKRMSLLVSVALLDCSELALKVEIAISLGG